MLHITQNYYLDVCPECFILQEKYITPEFNEKTKEPNKKAGEEIWINKTFHPTHKDVVNKLMDICLRHAVNEQTELFFEVIEDVKKNFEEILKVKRGHERW